MAWRAYLVPKIGTGALADPWRPKYVFESFAGVKTDGCDYGKEDLFLVWAELTPAQHTTLTANGDVFGFAADPFATVGAGALTALQNALEARNIPGTWVASGTTNGAVFARLKMLFRLMRRVAKRWPDAALFSGRTLNTLIGDLPANARTALNDGAQDLGLNTSGITLAMTIRQALVTLMGQV